MPIPFSATPDCPPGSRRIAEELLARGVITTASAERRDLELACGAEGLTLCAQPDSGSVLTLHIDLGGGSRGYRQARAVQSREDLVRALGRLPRGSTVLDASAGLGRDALVLAGWGFEVVALERHPLLAALLEDAMERACSDPNLRTAIGRVDLQQGNTRDWLSRHGRVFDAAVFDPMFPPRRKDAQVKKDMRVLHRLLGANADADAPETLAALLGYVRKCVVVKRPLHAPLIGDLQPARSLRGRSTRFDVYLPRTPAGGNGQGAAAKPAR